MSTEGLSRRRALTGAVAAGVTVPLLAACGGEDDAVDTTPQAETGELLASTSDVAVGACAVYEERKVVVTQPAEGEFKCFSAVCPHQGCTVSSSSEGHIPCSCHGSRFSLEDGSVLDGPARSPLTEVPITVTGDRITMA